MSAVMEAMAAAGTPQEAHRAALDAGRLMFQRCEECAGAWLPPREECPHCWSTEWKWEEASGKAKIVSWVIYHTAFDKRFAGRLPYNVTLVELAEGPRMVTNLVDLPADTDVTGLRASLVFEHDMDRHLPRFRLDGETHG